MDTWWYIALLFFICILISCILIFRRKLRNTRKMIGQFIEDSGEVVESIEYRGSVRERLKPGIRLRYASIYGNEPFEALVASKSDKFQFIGYAESRPIEGKHVITIRAYLAKNSVEFLFLLSRKLTSIETEIIKPKQTTGLKPQLTYRHAGK